MHLPWEPGTLPGEPMGRPLHISRGEAQQRPAADRTVPVDRGALAHARRLHVVEQAAHVVTGQVAFEGPGRVRVPNGYGEVRHALEHHALVDQLAGDVHALPADAELDPADEQQLEAGSGDDDVGLELVAGLQQQAPFGERVDVSGVHGDPAAADRLEHVAVGARAGAMEKPWAHGLYRGVKWVGIYYLAGSRREI